jgi:F1F0 ATPase subunit 2
MTTPVPSLVLSLAAGVGVGIIYLGGLWWTVRRLAVVKRPGLLLFSSFLVRTGLALVCLYLLTGKDWIRLMAALLGFLVVRFVMVWFLRPEGQTFPAVEKK